MGLTVRYQGAETPIANGSTATVGSDPAATISIERPGISRQHLLIKHDGHHWVVQDASSRNGTYHDGARIQMLDVSGPTTIRLGHPNEGELLELTPTTEDTPTPAPAPPLSTTRVDTPVSPAPGTTHDPQIDELVRSLRDTMASVRGLTWSVWAMIAITAVLALLTLFVAIIGV